jgi:hypothetical protein
MEALIKHRGEILRDTIHAARANRFNARLLNRLKYSSSLLTGRLQPAMHRGVVAGKTQGNRIGVPADHRRFSPA